MLCGGGGPHQTLVSCQVPCHVTRPGWMDGWMETGTGLHDTLVFIILFLECATLNYYDFIFITPLSY